MYKIHCSPTGCINKNKMYALNNWDNYTPGFLPLLVDAALHTHIDLHNYIIHDFTIHKHGKR